MIPMNCFFVYSRMQFEYFYDLRKIRNKNDLVEESIEIDNHQVKFDDSLLAQLNQKIN